MAGPSDPFDRLRVAWNVALNEDALRLLRAARTDGAFERRRSHAIVGRPNLTRSAAEDLADRLQAATLIERTEGTPVAFVLTPLGEAVAAFIEQQTGARRQSLRPATVLVLE